MEIFSTLLALCARNSPVTGEFPSQRPVTWSYDVFFDVCLNKRLSKQSWDWWFGTPSRPIWRYSVLPKVFWAPVLRTSGSWNLPVRMEGSLVRNFNNYYVLLIHVFDGCSNRFDLCDHFNLVCCCLSPVLISDKRSCWKISQSLKPIWLDVEMLVPLF